MFMFRLKNLARKGLRVNIHVPVSITAIMLTQVLQQSRQVLLTQFRRNFGVTAVVTQKASDPIQQLFLDKIRDYSKKSKWVLYK